MMPFARAPRTLRGVALTVALAVATAGNGLPMCLTVLAHLAAPCAMHTGHQGDQAPHHRSSAATLSAQPPSQACHPGDAGPGCTGSACPTGGPAAPAGVQA
ncbi:MAG TPA: hypothetical protein VH137_00285, partial [Gemmatimonadales bacterium]|nr:hypothetical protein [Gemmatimonadales bacterium]